MGRYRRTSPAVPKTVVDVREGAAQLEWSVTMKAAPYVLASQMVRPALSTNSTMPVLGYILHKADAQGRLWLHATNLTTYASAMVGGQSWPANWSIALPPLMSDVLHAFRPDATVELALGDVETMYVRGRAATSLDGMYSFKGVDAAAFPARFDMTGDKLTMALADFRRMQRLRYAVAAETKYARNDSMSMLFSSPSTGEFATDGYVLALTPDATETLRMSPAIVQWLVQWNDSEPDDMPVLLEMNPGGTLVTASTPTMSIASWVTESKAPDVERFRTTPPLSVHVIAREDAEQLRRLLPIMGKNSEVGIVHMFVADGQLIVRDRDDAVNIAMTTTPPLPNDWHANPIWKNLFRVLRSALADGEGDVRFCLSTMSEKFIFVQGASEERHWCVVVSNE